MPTSGASSHSSPRAVSPSSTGKAERPTAAIRTVISDDEPDRREEAPRQRPARLPRLLGEVRDRLEAREGEHRERQREREIVPARRDPDVDPGRERVGREDEREAEHDEQELRREVERRDHERRRVQLRPPHEADRRDRGDHRRPRRRRPTGESRERVDAERGAEVVRQEERRERDHDQVVEEEHPAGEEAEQVVERTPDEGRRAARLGDRCRPLRVREGDEQEEDAGAEQDDGSQAERVGRDDSEREVERGRDLAVRDREERGRVEDSLEARSLRATTAPLASATSSGRRRVR